jgi:hypothetical protein
MQTWSYVHTQTWSYIHNSDLIIRTHANLIIHTQCRPDHSRPDHTHAYIADLTTEDLIIHIHATDLIIEDLITADLIIHIQLKTWSLQTWSCTYTLHTNCRHTDADLIVTLHPGNDTSDIAQMEWSTQDQPPRCTKYDWPQGTKESVKAFVGLKCT